MCSIATTLIESSTSAAHLVDFSIVVLTLIDDLVITFLLDRILELGTHTFQVGFTFLTFALFSLVVLIQLVLQVVEVLEFLDIHCVKAFKLLLQLLILVHVFGSDGADTSQSFLGTLQFSSTPLYFGLQLLLALFELLNHVLHLFDLLVLIAHQISDAFLYVLLLCVRVKVLGNRVK